MDQMLLDSFYLLDTCELKVLDTTFNEKLDILSSQSKAASKVNTILLGLINKLLEKRYSWASAIYGLGAGTQAYWKDRWYNYYSLKGYDDNQHFEIWLVASDKNFGSLELEQNPNWKPDLVFIRPVPGVVPIFTPLEFGTLVVNVFNETTKGPLSITNPLTQKVKIVDATGHDINTTNNVWTFTNVQVGGGTSSNSMHTIRVQWPGFKEFLQYGIKIERDKTTVVNIYLTDGTASNDQVAVYSLFTEPDFIFEGMAVKFKAFALINGCPGNIPSFELFHLNDSPIATFYDNGSNGDETAGDGFYACQTSYTVDLAVGNHQFTAIAVDAQGTKKSITTSLTIKPIAGSPFTNTIGIQFVWIPAGTFTMGSPDTDGEATADEEPEHSVTLTQGFWMGSMN